MAPEGSLPSPWSRPGRIAARLARQVELGLAGTELTLAQYRVLMLLSHQAEGASRLADHLAVSKPSITSVMDGLVARGLVVRHQDSEDRRRVEHRLTGDGRRLLDEADGAVEARFEEIASYLGDSGLIDEAMAGLERWRQALDTYRTSRVRQMEAKA
jgi:long-chain acyl-CoA synthetase